MTPTDTIAELWAELGRGRIVEAHVTADDKHMDGLCVFPDTVYINPAPAVVNTLLHELMHRRWPDWSERKVERTVSLIMGHMTDADVRRWYRAYQRAKRTQKRPVDSERYDIKG